MADENQPQPPAEAEADEDAAAGNLLADAEEAARRNRASRGSVDFLPSDSEEAELLEIIRIYLLVAIITGTFASMVCHVTGKCRPLYTWMIAVTILPAWALMVFLFPMLPYLVLALLMTSFYEACFYLLQYFRGDLEPDSISTTSPDSGQKSIFSRWIFKKNTCVRGSKNK